MQSSTVTQVEATMPRKKVSMAAASHAIADKTKNPDHEA
jgi:hypothetical protein